MKYTFKEFKRVIEELRDSYQLGNHKGGIENCPLCILLGVDINTDDRSCNCKYCINSVFEKTDKVPYFSCVERMTYKENDDNINAEYWSKVIIFLEGKTEKDIFKVNGEIKKSIGKELIKIDKTVYELMK